jgi:hypothetical protein
MPRYWNEPTLSDTLSDPVIQAIMAADHVDPDALGDLLRETAHKVRFGVRSHRPADPGEGSTGRIGTRRGQ